MKMNNDEGTWYIACVDEDHEVKIMKRSKNADDYVDDPDEFVEYALTEFSRGKPAGVYKITISAELLHEI